MLIFHSLICKMAILCGLHFFFFPNVWFSEEMHIGWVELWEPAPWYWPGSHVSERACMAASPTQGQKPPAYIYQSGDLLCGLSFTASGQPTCIMYTMEASQSVISLFPLACASFLWFLFGFCSEILLSLAKDVHLDGGRDERVLILPQRNLSYKGSCSSELSVFLLEKS